MENPIKAYMCGMDYKEEVYADQAVHSNFNGKILRQQRLQHRTYDFKRRLGKNRDKIIGH